MGGDTIARLSIYEQWKKDGELKDKLLLTEGWAREGLTQEQIAKNLGISVDTLLENKKKYPDFYNALKKGAEVVDFEVENALLRSALEGNTTAQIFWLKNRKALRWREKVQTNDEEKDIKNAKDIIVKIREIADNGEPNRDKQ